VLSRLLFNKEATKLSALQVVQLTRAAAELSGRGGGGLTDRLRSAAGLATLDFEGGEDGKGGPSVKVGKYIGDKIYLSIQQGKSLDSSKVGVKVDITPNISVESRVDQAGDSDIGIIYRYDY
jgi:translocation and assembly module TamB